MKYKSSIKIYRFLSIKTSMDYKKNLANSINYKLNYLNFKKIIITESCF